VAVLCMSPGRRGAIASLEALRGRLRIAPSVGIPLRRPALRGGGTPRPGVSEHSGESVMGGVRSRRGVQWRGLRRGRSCPAAGAAWGPPAARPEPERLAGAWCGLGPGCWGTVASHGRPSWRLYLPARPGLPARPVSEKGFSVWRRVSSIGGLRDRADHGVAWLRIGPRRTKHAADLRSG